jgi:hypothetical protein
MQLCMNDMGAFLRSTNTPQIRCVLVSDTIDTELYHFLILLSVSTCQLSKYVLHRCLLNNEFSFCVTGLSSLKGDGLIHKGFRHQSKKHLIPRNKVSVIRAVAIPVEPAPVESAEYRKQLAERYGFEQIGELLPDNVTLKDVITSLPKKVDFLMIYVMFCSVRILSLSFRT